MKNLLTIALAAFCLNLSAAEAKKPNKAAVDAEFKKLTVGLKSEHDKFTKATTYQLTSVQQHRLTVELVDPDQGKATIHLKAVTTIPKSNTPIRTQKLMVMIGDEVLEVVCTEGNYRFVEGRNSGATAAILALGGDTYTRPPDKEEISADESNPEVASIIKKLAASEKSQKVEVRFSGQQSKLDFKLPERDRALFAQMVALRDYLNMRKVEPNQPKDSK